LLAVPEKPRVKVPKPRVKAPQQRVAQPKQRSWSFGQRPLVLGIAGVVVLAAVLGVGVFVLLGSGSGGTQSAAGCTEKDYPGVSRAHITNPDAHPKSWNSFPPTSGPHYFTPAVYGFYSEPVALARLVHNLEHGGVYMLYGPKTPSDTVDTLRKVYDKDPRGLVVAPLPALGNKIALGAWTSKNPGSNDVGTGHLEKCTRVNTKTVQAFIDKYRGHGPQAFPLDALQPGST
jgi:Protein of unknown function (DUF3105)